MSFSAPISLIPAITKATTSSEIGAKSNTTFKSLFDAVKSRQLESDLGFNSPLQQISKIKETLSSAEGMQPKDILVYQIQISELNLRVEMLSKAADSALAMTRKLQNAQ